MTIGRILRIDTDFRKFPNARWKVPLLIHGFLGVCAVMLLVCPPPPNPESPPQPHMLWIMLGIWIAGGVALELWTRFLTSYELQLLPAAVRIKKWSCDELLVEPEVIGGRIGWLNVIYLRAGDRRARIDLDWYHKREDRAAIIEHCSQFLTAEQQAAYGHEWARRYHKLLSPRKPPAPATLRGMLRTIGITYLIGFAICLVTLEPMIAYGVSETKGGVSLRMIYAIWTATCLFFCFLCGAMISTSEKRDRQRELAMQNQSTATMPAG